MIYSLIIWTILFLLTGGLFWLGGYQPWLVNRLDGTPIGFYLIWIFIAVPVLISHRFVNRFWIGYLNVLRRLYRLLKRRPVLVSFLIVLGVGLCFWFFRIQRLDSGDQYLHYHAAREGRAFLVEHAPLETLIRCWLSEILYIWPQASLVTIFKVLSCFYGGCYVLILFWFGARLPRPYSFLAPLFFLLTPILAVFCGYHEIYGPALIVQLIFFFTGLLFLHNRAPIAAVTCAFGMTLAFGFWHGVLGLAYLYLLIMAWRRKEFGLGEALLHLILSATPVLVSLALLEQYANSFAGLITRIGESRNYLFFQSASQMAGYALFSLKHLADFANVTLVNFWAPLVMILTRITCDSARTWRRLRSAEGVFFLLAVCPSLCLGFVYNPVIGFPLDWDLYTFIFPGLSLLGAAVMSNVLSFRVWRKWALVVFIAGAALASAWTLQNALFWRYPVLISNFGPVISAVVPDFYFRHMKNAVERYNAINLYWLADHALEESPGRYREILEYMDTLTISIIAQVPPEAYDYPGWACDLEIVPGPPERVFVFDKYGRIFLHREQGLKWIFASSNLVDSPIVAGDINQEGAAILLSENGKVFRVAKEILEKGITDSLVWGNLERLKTFLPESPSKRGLPVKMIDLAIRGDTGAIYVLDNFNRVWDMETESLILVREGSYNTAAALHFNYAYQPITIDVNNHLTYDESKVKFPFSTPWFYPIIRDFMLTPDEKGLITLDLNGNVHYSGATPVYKDMVLYGAITDRYKKFVFVQSRQSLLLLDNRYRMVYAELDPSGATARQKVGDAIASGNYTTAFSILNNLWHKGSQFTPVCYELIDTEMIRKARGAVILRPEEAIPMFIDALPVSEERIILLDRWGRLAVEDKGVLYMMEGTGLRRWPQREAADGTLAGSRVLFLCRDGTVWEYPTINFLNAPTPTSNHTPTMWGDLNDYADGNQWIGIESIHDGSELIAVSSNGVTLRLGVEGKTLAKRFELPNGNALFDFAVRESEHGLTVAYTSETGPAFLYTEWDESHYAIPDTHYGWPIISDILFARDDNIILLDKYGVIHQYSPVLHFSDKPYTGVMDTVALRFLPSGKKAIWLRSNGDIRTLRVK